jgi:hypothetical protein
LPNGWMDRGQCIIKSTRTGFSGYNLWLLPGTSAPPLPFALPSFLDSLGITPSGTPLVHLSSSLYSPLPLFLMSIPAISPSDWLATYISTSTQILLCMYAVQQLDQQSIKRIYTNALPESSWALTLRLEGRVMNGHYGATREVLPTMQVLINHLKSSRLKYNSRKLSRGSI